MIAERVQKPDRRRIFPPTCSRVREKKYGKRGQRDLRAGGYSASRLSGRRASTRWWPQTSFTCWTSRYKALRRAGPGLQAGRKDHRPHLHEPDGQGHNERRLRAPSAGRGRISSGNSRSRAYRQFFAGGGLPDAQLYALCRGRIPCAVAVLVKDGRGNAMKVETLDEGADPADIGHAFGYYDYGGEHGLIDAFPEPGRRGGLHPRLCANGAAQSGMLYAHERKAARATSPTNAPAKKSGPVPRCRWPKAFWGP